MFCSCDLASFEGSKLALDLLAMEKAVAQAGRQPGVDLLPTSHGLGHSFCDAEEGCARFSADLPILEPVFTHTQPLPVYHAQIQRAERLLLEGGRIAVWTLWRKHIDRLGKSSSAQVIEAAWERRHTWAAGRVCDMLQDLSGYYVKSAQIMASKSDFLPLQWTEKLTPIFFDNMQPRDWRDVHQVWVQICICILLVSGLN